MYPYCFDDEEWMEPVKKGTMNDVSITGLHILHEPSGLTYSGDLYRCPVCGRKTVSSFGEGWNMEEARKLYQEKHSL